MSHEIIDRGLEDCVVCAVCGEECGACQECCEMFHDHELGENHYGDSICANCAGE